MSAITVRDLACSLELDRHAMSAVRGGMHKAFAAYWAPYYKASKSSFELDASQLIGQTQNVVNMNGNNVAFAGHIHSTVNPVQAANNNISF